MKMIDKKVCNRMVFLEEARKYVIKNVNKFVHKIFYLAKKVFNIVIGNFYFQYLLTHLHISPPSNRGTFVFKCSVHACLRT